MTHHTPYVPPDERAHGVGATGGLPGANADPRAAEMDPEDLASTVAAGDAPGGAAPDVADELGSAGSGGLTDAGTDDRSADGSAVRAGHGPTGDAGDTGAATDQRPDAVEGGDLARREGDLDDDGGEADAEARTQAGLS